MLRVTLVTAVTLVGHGSSRPGHTVEKKHHNVGDFVPNDGGCVFSGGGVGGGSDGRDCGMLS